MKKINSLNKKQKIILVIIAIIITTIIVYNFYIKEDEFIKIDNIVNMQNSKEESKEDIAKQDNSEENQQIIVHVSGAVNIEGIVKLPQNSRIADAIEKSNGLKEDANIQDINLAYILEDGMKIYIPSKNENSKEDKIDEKNNNYYNNYESEQYNNINNKKQSRKININTATQTELETLPGIGPSTALKIINYRKEQKTFSNIEEIKEVSGIGDSKFEKIKDLITTK